MPKGLTTPFQAGHDVAYGLEILERDGSNGSVSSVLCRFCVAFGREAKPGQKRKRSAHPQIFKTPFRVDSYKRHNVSAHPEKWGEFQELNNEQKKVYFDGLAHHDSTLLAHFDSEGPLTITFNRNIIEDIIGNVLFDPDDVAAQGTREKALATFKLFEDGIQRPGQANNGQEDQNREVYYAKITSVRLFRMVVGFVSKGASFRSASQFISVARDVGKLSYLKGGSEENCARFIRIVCAGSLQALHDQLQDRWAYSLALDVGHSQGTSYLDLRVRVCNDQGIIGNWHLLAIPLFERKTADIHFGLCERVLDVIDPRWRTKLISIGTDGERTMTGRLSGVQTRFEAAARFPIVRIWCGLHQFDLVAKREYQKLGNETFVTTLTALVAYLRRQQNLQAEMKSTCPKFVSTRWLSMKKLTLWLVQNRIRVLEYLAEKTPVCTPTREWWIILICLNSVATMLAATSKSLQGLSTLLSQQVAQFNELRTTLAEFCAVQGPLAVDEAASLNLDEYVVQDEYDVKVSDGLAYVQDQGTFVIDSLAELPDDAVNTVAKSIASLFLGLYTGILTIVATRDSNNEASRGDLPPVLPHSLKEIRTARVCELIRTHRNRLQETGWSAEQIEQIEIDHRSLLQAYRSEPLFHSNLDRCNDATTTFEQGWGHTNNRFPTLWQFCGGLATMFPNTARVEADFSLIGIEKNEYRQSLTDLSLEGILHAKQFKNLCLFR